MSMSDPIADMLTRIRNASSAKIAELSMPSSNMRASLAETLQEAGYIESYRIEEQGNNKKQLSIVLKYKGKEQTPVIEGIKRISKPSRRVYVGCADIPRVLGGLGIAIMSTSNGLFTDRQARKLNMGGEVLCYVW